MLRLESEVKRLRLTIKELSQPLHAMLRMRGFTVYKKEPCEDLLLPDERFIESYYKVLHKYSFRLFLRDVIKHRHLFTINDVTKYATREVTKEYIDYLAGVGIAEALNGQYRLKKQAVKSFGPTLEWFLSEIFKREFSSEAIWGIKFKRPDVGGDYDLIAKIETLLLYMEIKSSPPKQIYANEITAFLERACDLLPDVSVFFMDTELRMKDKIVPMFENEVREMPLDKMQRVFGMRMGSGAPEIERIENELFHIKDKIFIINAKDSIAGNIEKVLTSYLRKIE